MVKALLKKQFQEAAAFFLLTAKDGKKRKPIAVVGFAVLMLYVFFSGGLLFWMMADALCLPLVQSGLGWVYFALMGTIATAFGVIINIFMAKSKIYEAKDNELLLSMPVSPSAILFSRMVGLYVFAFLFEALALIPAFLCYAIRVDVTFFSCLFQIFILIILPLGALAISCLLGWLLTVITARLSKKNLMTTILFLVFFFGCFYVYQNVTDYLNYVLLHGEAVGQTMKTVLFPLWKMGEAALGGGLAFGVFALIFLGFFALVYFMMSATFLRFVTIKRGETAPKYKEKERGAMSSASALFIKEWRRFIKSPAYFLNAGMGCFMLILFAVLTLIYGNLFGLTTETLGREYMGLILAAVLCFISVMNFISACSVSLEGETLWQVRVLPVDSWVVLKAKMYLHFVVTAIPAYITTAIMCIVLGVGGWYAVSIYALVTAAIAFSAAFGLVMNLKFPNLHWTNETAAVKQGISVLIAMLGCMGAVLLLVGGYFLFGRFLSAVGYIWVAFGLLISTAFGLGAWLKKYGV